MESNHQNSWTDKAYKNFNARPITDSQILIVEKIKETASMLWDQLDNISVTPGNAESGRLVALAKTDLENTVMWATKAISRQ